MHTIATPPVERGGVLIEGARVVGVGAPDELRTRFGAKIETIDLGDQVLLPAFIDAHVHLLEMVRNQAGLDLSGVRSGSEVAKILRESCAEGEGWQLCFGLDQHRFQGWGGSARELLDGACRSRPVVVASQDLHTLWGNSAALMEAKVKSETGELKEAASMPLRRLLPIPDGAEWDQAFGRVAGGLLRHGVARVEDFSGLRIHRRLAVAQTRFPLPVKVTTSIRAYELDDALDLSYRSGRQQGGITCGHLKLFADGSLGSKTAWMLEPYLESGGFCGQASSDPEELGALVTEAHRRGLRVGLHAIGTAAVRQSASLLGPNDRIEHAQHVHPDDFARIAAAGCSACVNPSHIGLDWEAAERMLPNRGHGSYPFGSFARAGVQLAFGSDAPVADANPLDAIGWAVTRQSQDGKPPGGWHSEEKIGIAQAFAAATADAARACFAPDEGVIAPGVPADLVVLDRDPFELPPDQLRQVRVTRMWVEGREQML